MKHPSTAAKFLALAVIVALFTAWTPLRAAFGQSATLTFKSNADSQVVANATSTNYGTKTYLTLDNTPVTRAYVRFNVSGLNGAKITSAKLKVYSLYASSSGFTVYKANSSSWTETGITYNNAPGFGSALRSTSTFKANVWLTLDLTGSVTGEGQVTYVLTTPGSDAFTLASRERSSGAYAPQLIITTGSAAPTATKTATKAPTATPTATKAPTSAPTATKAPASIPTATGAPASVPTATKAPTSAPTATGAPASVPTATKAPTTAPTPTKAPTLAPTIAPNSGDQPYGVSGNWVLKFADDFNGTSLDTNKWEPNWLAGNDTTITKPINSNELSCYDPAQVSVVNGALKLSAVARSCKASNGTTYSYASGMVTSRPHYTFNYGFMEARVWVDGSTTIKNWPAFWADGTGTWPTTGEIDVFEGLNGRPSWHYHYGSTSSPQQSGGYPSLSPSTGWHIFAADWEPGVITFYYDGKNVGQVTSSVVNSQMFLILNYGVSTTISPPVQVPSDFLVDYVRVWQKQ